VIKPEPVAKPGSYRLVETRISRWCPSSIHVPAQEENKRGVLRSTVLSKKDSGYDFIMSLNVDMPQVVESVTSPILVTAKADAKLNLRLGQPDIFGNINLDLTVLIGPTGSVRHHISAEKTGRPIASGAYTMAAEKSLSLALNNEWVKTDQVVNGVPQMRGVPVIIGIGGRNVPPCSMTVVYFYQLVK